MENLTESAQHLKLQSLFAFKKYKENVLCHFVLERSV